jgi:hypothetical protein
MLSRRSVVSFWHRSHWSDLWILLAVCARFISPTTADLSFLMIAVYALLGQGQAIRALALSWLFITLNSGLVPESINATVGRYAVLFAAFLSVTLRSSFVRFDRFVFFSAVLGLFFVLHSFLFSPIPDVSILKALNWLFAILTLSLAWGALDLAARDEVQQWLFGLLVVIALASLPFLLFPMIGYLRNGSGFQGVLNHPQSFGPTMALLSAFALGRLLAKPQPSWRLVALFFGCLILVILSEARTAGVALVFSFTISLLFISIQRGRKIRAFAPALRSKRLGVVGALALIAIIGLGPQLSDLLSNFISKSGKGQVIGLFDAFDDSRGILISQMTENIENNLFTGVGFGIPSDPSLLVVSRDPIFGLPLGAPVEKGVLPIAVLEEVGLLGLFLVSIWIWILLRRAVINGLTSLMLVFTALLINIGEAVLFSPGGMGMLLLILLAFAASKPKLVSLDSTIHRKLAINVK